MATITSLTSIATPSSSSTSLCPDLFHSFSHFSPKPVKHLLKTLTLKPHSFTLSHLPLHLCHCTASSAFDNVESTGTLSDDVQVDAASEASEVGENDESKATDTTDVGRIYVGNLPYTVTSSDLSEIFSRAGQIKSVEIIYDKVTERSRGFGFVTMESSDEAKEAIRMFDGSQVEGRTVRVNLPEVARGGERRIMAKKARLINQSFVDTPHKVYAGNLAWGVTTEGLRDAFAGQDGFLSAKVIYERERGRSRGFGFVSFQSGEAAQSAISAMDGVELEGRPLRLNIATDRNRSNATETTADQSEVTEVLSAVNP